MIIFPDNLIHIRDWGKQRTKRNGNEMNQIMGDDGEFGKRTAVKGQRGRGRPRGTDRRPAPLCT